MVLCVCVVCVSVCVCVALNIHPLTHSPTHSLARSLVCSSRYEPDRVPLIDSVMRHFAGREGDLVAMLAQAIQRKTEEEEAARRVGCVRRSLTQFYEQQAQQQQQQQLQQAQGNASAGAGASAGRMMMTVVQIQAKVEDVLRQYAGGCGSLRCTKIEGRKRRRGTLFFAELGMK